MDIDKNDIAGLFDRPQRYLVPLFQRSYVWKEETQWQPLWDDLVTQFDAIHAGTAKNRKERKHFLGTLVLSQMRKVPRQLAGYLIIDGQQRLTTIQIMLAAFRDLVSPLGNAYLIDSLQRLTTNPTAGYEENEKFKVWPTNVDRLGGATLGESTS